MNENGRYDINVIQLIQLNTIGKFQDCYIFEY